MAKLRVLRIGMTYPRDVSPGIGLHMFYHSLYSEYDELIITAKREGVMPKNRQGVKIVEIENENPKMGTYNQSKIKRFKLFLNKLRSQRSFLNKSKKYIDEFLPDLVHVYSPIPILCGIYARRKYGSKIVMSLHGSDVYRISQTKILGKVLEIPDVVTAVSENMEDALPKVNLKRPIQYIGNGADLEVFKNNHLNRKKQFIHVANLRWQKGQKYLIEGFAEFLQNHGEYRLLIIGEGEERENLKKRCKELKVENSVVFMGTQGRSFIADQLNESKAFVLTSVTEGFPKVIIESMATGTPIISTDVGNVRRVVGAAGIIIEPKKPEKIREAMEQMIASEEHWNRMSVEGEKNSSQFSWENHVVKLMQVYGQLMEE